MDKSLKKKRWISTWGFGAVICYGKCDECPQRFRCYTMEHLELLEVTLEERFISQSPDVPDGV